jgi:hypothetical protein
MTAKHPRRAWREPASDVFTFDLGITPKNLDYLRKGMRRVVGPGGTAQLTRLRDWDFLGKTGSSQACANCGLPDHAWFVGIGGLPGQKAELSLACSFKTDITAGSRPITWLMR